jgi:hypothetical protein
MLVSRKVEITVKSMRKKRPTNGRLLRFCAIQGLLHNKNGNVRFIPAYPRPDGLSEQGVSDDRKAIIPSGLQHPFTDLYRSAPS